MFSNPTKNRLRRKTASISDLGTDLRATKKGSKKAETEMHLLHAKIGVLENYLAKRAESEVNHSQMRRGNVLPPPDATPSRAQRTTDRSYSETRRYHAARNRAGVRFLMLFGVACALGWWLIIS